MARPAQFTISFLLITGAIASTRLDAALDSVDGLTLLVSQEPPSGLVDP
jgi:hypothetical protein